MKRETLQSLKRTTRKMDHHPSRQTEHALIDHGLEALDVIDGGATAVNRTKEVRKALADVRELLGPPIYAEDADKVRFMVDLIDTQLLTTDYRRYSTWDDIKPQVEEEFS